MGLFVMKYLSQGRPLHARLARLRHTPLAWLVAALGLATAPLPELQQPLRPQRPILLATRMASAH